MLWKTAYIWLRKICNVIVIFGNRVLFSKQKLEVEGVMIERQGILEQVQSDIQQATSELGGKYLWKAAQRISVSDMDLGSEIAQTKTDSVFAISTATASPSSSN